MSTAESSVRTKPVVYTLQTCPSCIVLKEDWGGGAVYDIIITNRSAAPVEGWQIAMDLPFDIAEMWNAALVSDSGARVTVRNGEWNGAIAPGEAVDFGFVSDAGGVALDALVSGAAYPRKYGHGGPPCKGHPS